MNLRDIFELCKDEGITLVGEEELPIVPMEIDEEGNNPHGLHRADPE